MTEDDWNALNDIYEGLRRDTRVIRGEHRALHQKPFHAEAYRLHRLRLSRHREALGAFRGWLARLREVHPEAF